jgi:hypothetical protein
MEMLCRVGTPGSALQKSTGLPESIVGDMDAAAASPETKHGAWFVASLIAAKLVTYPA